MRKAGIADKTILWHHQLISNIFCYAMRTLRCAGENVALDANPPRRRTTAVQVPEGEQVAKLIEAADRDGHIFGAFVSPSSRAYTAASGWHAIDRAMWDADSLLPATMVWSVDSKKNFVLAS